MTSYQTCCDCGSKLQSQQTQKASEQQYIMFMSHLSDMLIIPLKKQLEYTVLPWDLKYLLNILSAPELT